MDIYPTKHFLYTTPPLKLLKKTKGNNISEIYSGYWISNIGIGYPKSFSKKKLGSEDVCPDETLVSSLSNIMSYCVCLKDIDSCIDCFI